MRGETVKVVRYTPTGETDPGGSPVTKVDIESVALHSPASSPAATHTGVCAGRVCASIHMTTR